MSRHETDAAALESASNSDEWSQVATKRDTVKNAVQQAGPVGTDLLNDPILNKGTAFTDEERNQLGLHGLLPPHVESLEEQVVRAYEAYKRKDDDLERHIYLRALQDTNEVLFYRLLLDHIEEMTPMGQSVPCRGGRFRGRCT